MILGIDFGSSTVDGVLMKNKKLIKTHSVSSNKFSLDTFLKKFTLNKVHVIKATGSGSLRLKNKIKGIEVRKVDEIEAIGLGGCFVSNKKKALIVSIGSGTAIVSADKTIKHVGGTAIGGRTVSGLGKLLTGTKNVEKIEHLAEKGNLKNIDLTLEEIYPEGIGLLDKNATASHFGNIKKASKQDKALALLNMAAQTIGSLASFAALATNQDSIILTGRLTKSKIVKDIVKKRISTIKKIPVIIPRNAEYATAIGAIIAAK